MKAESVKLPAFFDYKIRTQVGVLDLRSERCTVRNYCASLRAVALRQTEESVGIRKDLQYTAYEPWQKPRLVCWCTVRNSNP